MKWLVWLTAYGACPAFAMLVIWLKQGRYLTEDQPFACFLLGPLAPFIAMLPRSCFTSRAQSEGRRDDA
jgi:hypothetical protein